MQPNCVAITIRPKRTGHQHIAIIPHDWLRHASFFDCVTISRAILRDGHETAEMIQLCKYLRNRQKTLPFNPVLE